ncbi:hypothetical protein TcasGA2_TC031925 [Tribolium castaneum]|uniref:THAP-type domain-containing protein n=1 Tax=Tribolium castaneum TaxID=7070 RepID=A0A139WA74_TRICA|nr:PREDICTED: uncharacterized protein LOC103314168 isoform X1 [Tribolium castaneum]KYB24812.1 hypothetical protein TcasGA2_TC031925 [Tribolium castaneum]|eukprot:XP_015839904.1 PREDICTED: uncharacterized protein LOC103314168 isoform X1 [Tribolium castaneum]
MWIKALRREDLTDTKIKYGRICSRHFHSGKPAALKDTTHPDWVPSKNMGYNVTGKKKLERYQRCKAREVQCSRYSRIWIFFHLEFADFFFFF